MEKTQLKKEFEKFKKRHGRRLSNFEVADASLSDLPKSYDYLWYCFLYRRYFNYQILLGFAYIVLGLFIILLDLALIRSTVATTVVPILFILALLFCFGYGFIQLFGNIYLRVRYKNYICTRGGRLHRRIVKFYKNYI